MHDKTEESMVAASQTSEPQVDAITELASIKTLLQGIASDMTGLKSGMDAVQAAVEKLGTQMTEAEARISVLEDQGQATGTTVDGAVKTIKQLHDKIIYLEDASCHNNVHIVRVTEEAEGWDIQDFVQRLLLETLGIDVSPDFEINRAHRTGQRGSRDRHILVCFLRSGAREAVLRAAREKKQVEWRGKKRLSFIQDLHRKLYRGSRCWME